jgi:hypothetical protein
MTADRLVAGSLIFFAAHDAAWLGFLSRSPLLSKSTQTWLRVSPCQATQSGPFRPNTDYALIRQSAALPQSAPPSTESTQGQCSAQTIPGTVHRESGPVAYLQSVHGPVPNTLDGTLSAQTKNNALHQNPVHGSGGGSLRHTVSARLGAVG